MINYHKMIQKNLKDLIDWPIVDTVAYLNILGFKTIWSCCGYNYPNDDGKCHQMGQTYFIIDIDNDDNILKSMLLNLLEERPEVWQLICRKTPNFNKTRYDLHFIFPSQNKSWTYGTKHFYEIPAVEIFNLNEILKQKIKILKQSNIIFPKTITVTDSNSDKVTVFGNLWQVEVGSPWVIDVDNYIKNI